MQNLLETTWWRLVRFGFRLLYNEMAFTYDTVAWAVSMGQWRNWQRTALDHIDAAPGATVLEIAHGTGNLQLDLHAHGYHRIGIDLSRNMGRIARKKLARHHLSAPLVQASGEALPFPANHFDAVVSTFPTPFIIQPDTLHEVYRVLKPGKWLVIVINGVLVSGGPVRDALEAAYQVTGQRGPYPPNLGNYFTAAGFSLESIAQKCPLSYAQLLIATKHQIIGVQASS